jgi:hypothetical protein
MGQKIVGYLANNAVGVLALFVALGGVSYAASGGFSSGGTLKACVNEEGVVRLLKTGRHCKRGQKAVSWNQTGPVGPKGSAGATGATGPIGLTGASGQPSNVMWAKIGAEGTLEAGHGVTDIKDNGEAPYTVTFEKDVTNCAVVATQNSPFTGGVVTTAKQDPGSGKAEVWIEAPGIKEHLEARFSIIAVC